MNPGLYDLVMIDIAGDDGFELYHKIRKLDDRVKICFLTAGEMHCEEIRNEAFPGLDILGLDTNCSIRNL